MKGSTLSIGGVSLQTSFKDDCAQDLGWAQYAPFLSERKKSAKNFHITADRRLHRGARSPSGITVANKPSETVFTRTDFKLRLPLSGGPARLTVAPNPYSFDSALRVLYSWALSKNQGLLVHAAGLLHLGRGFIFPGKSGKGKSTLVKSLGKSDALSDELVAFKFIRSKPFLFSTPFWGELSRQGGQRRAPLAGIFFLNQNPKTYAEPLAPKQAARKLLETVLWFDPSAAATGKVLDCAAKLVESVPCFILNLRKNDSPWPAVEAGLAL